MYNCKERIKLYNPSLTGVIGALSEEDNDYVKTCILRSQVINLTKKINKIIYAIWDKRDFPIYLHHKRKKTISKLRI